MPEFVSYETKSGFVFVLFFFPNNFFNFIGCYMLINNGFNTIPNVSVGIMNFWVF